MIIHAISSGVPMLPRGIMPLHPKLQFFPVPFPITSYRILATWHERSQTDPTHMWLRRRLADVARPARHEGLDAPAAQSAHDIT